MIKWPDLCRKHRPRLGTLLRLGAPNVQLVLARGNITNTDELLIILSEPDNEPAAVLIRWPAAASVASPAAFPTTASKITAWLPAPPYGSHSTRQSG
jgi:hypothetical protein